jgi:hypothetical protein
LPCYLYIITTGDGAAHQVGQGRKGKSELLAQALSCQELLDVLLQRIGRQPRGGAWHLYLQWWEGGGMERCRVEEERERVKYQCKEEGRAASAEYEAADVTEADAGKAGANKPAAAFFRKVLSRNSVPARQAYLSGRGASRAGSKGYSRTSLLPSGAAAASTGMVML